MRSEQGGFLAAGRYFFGNLFEGALQYAPHLGDL
jgi:hypothetical protein